MFFQSLLKWSACVRSNAFSVQVVFYGEPGRVRFSDQMVGWCYPALQFAHNRALRVSIDKLISSLVEQEAAQLRFSTSAADSNMYINVRGAR